MSFDKYLFEKYIIDCVVEIVQPKQGTGFWVSPDGHILTCYHTLRKLDFFKRDIDIENIDIKIRYHEKEYTALFDKEHSKQELDIAVLVVKQVDEKIHFVPLGEPELNTEVHIFGYMAGRGGKQTFKNGYHISGILRSGQVLNDGGSVYNLETNQPPNSSVGGMSGSPIYDLNKRKVVGIQYAEEEGDPSICYVHPIAKVYKLWPELRIKNFNSIRKDFNVYFMSSDLPKSIFILSMALLQDQLEDELGKEAIDSAEQTFVNIGDEKVVSNLYKILGTRLGANKFMDAILRANKYFHNNCKDGDSCDAFLRANKYFHNNCINGDLCNAFTMPVSNLLSAQAALNDLPKGLDQKAALEAIGENLERDYPELTEKQIKAGLDLYQNCLKKELLPLKGFISSIIKSRNKQTNQHSNGDENKLNNILENLEKYGAQRGIYMVLDDIPTGFGASTIEEQEKETRAQISILEEILNRETLHLSSGLSNWQPDEQPAYFLQQVYNRINNDGEIILKQAIEKLLTVRHQPWLAKNTPSRNTSIKHPSAKKEPFDSLKLTFTSDGKRVISFAPFDQTLYLWDVESGQFLRNFEGQASGIFCVAIATNGEHAIFASTDKIIRRWDIDSGRCSLISKQPEKNHIYDIAIIPKTQHALFAFSNGLLHLRDLEFGRILQIFEGHKEPCSSIAIALDGKFFLSASDDTTLRLWETNTGNLLRIFEGHSDKVFSVAIIPNSNQIISASADCTLRLWDFSTGQSLRIFKGHSKSIHGVVVTPDSKYAISASSDKTLRLWEISTGKCLSLLTGNEPFKCCAIAPNGSLIAAGDQAGEIHFIEIRNSDSLG